MFICSYFSFRHSFLFADKPSFFQPQISLSTPVRLERVRAEVPPTMQPHFPSVVSEPSYLKFGKVAVLTVTSAKICLERWL